MNYTIRKANNTDINEVFSLAEELSTSFVVDFNCFSVSFTNALSENNTCILVAEYNNIIIGYCLGFIHQTFYANGKVAWLEELIVTDKNKRNGIGKNLMSQFETWAKNQGAVLNALATRRAGQFYKAIDYKESATYFRKIF